MPHDPERVDVGALIPTTKGELAGVRDVEDFIARFQSPISQMGLALHKEFSGINLRGVNTHNVQVSRPSTHSSSTSERVIENIRVEKDSMAIVTGLKPEEVDTAGMSLRLLMNQLQLTSVEVVKGVIVLRNYHEDIPKSRCPYEVGLIVSDEALKAGKSGLVLTDYGSLSLLPNPKDQREDLEDSFSPITYRSQLEKRSVKILQALRSSSHNSSVTGLSVFHPIVAAAIVEAATLIARAIYRRKIVPDFENQS